MEGELRFYEAAAQVIPVLLVVLAFDARVFRDSALFHRTGWDRAFGTGVLLAALFGEVVALYVLYEGEAGEWADDFVSLAILLLLILVFFWTAPWKLPPSEDGE